MSLSSTGLAALLVVSHVGSVFATPQETNFANDGYNLNGVSPAPTEAPKISELKARKYGLEAHLQKRDFSSTCGYFDGYSDDPFVCDQDTDTAWACAFNNDKYYFGCCPIGADGEFDLANCPNVNNPYTGCYPYESASLCTGACYYQNRVCGSDYPFCGVDLLTTSGYTYQGWFCNSVQADATYYIEASATTAYSDESTSSTRTSSSSRTGTSSSSTSRTSLADPTTRANVDNPTSGSVASLAGTATAASETSASVSQQVQGKSTNVGAIAGGVVGGVVGLALIIGGIIYMLRRKKVAERKRASRMEISQVPQ